MKICPYLTYIGECACVYMRTCSLTHPEVDVFTGAGRFDVLVVDDDESHFVPLRAETVDGYVSCGDFVRLYGHPRVRRVNFILQSYSSHSVASTLSYRLQTNKQSNCKYSLRAVIIYMQPYGMFVNTVHQQEMIPCTIN